MVSPAGYSTPKKGKQALSVTAFGRIKRAIDMLQGKAKSLGRHEMEALAMRLARISDAAGYRESRNVLKELSLSKKSLRDFCSDEVSQTGKQINALQDRSGEMQKNLTKAVAQADKVAKEIPALHAEAARQQQAVNIAAAARNQAHQAYLLKWKQRQEQEQLEKQQVAAGGKLSLGTVKERFTQLVSADDALQQWMQVQTAEAVATADFQRADREALKEIQMKTERAINKQKDLEKMKTRLVHAAQEFQSLQEKAAAQKRYMDQIASKCSTAGHIEQKKPSKEELDVLKAAYEVL
jgi:hypothetical protein